MTDKPAPVFLEVATLSVSPDAAAREVSGLALPYGEMLDRPDWMTGARWQTFAADSATVRDNAAFFYGHDHLTDGLPVGRITVNGQTPEGLRITARISETPKGDEVYTLMRDGVLNRFSVGFYPVTNHVENAGTPDAVLVHDSVDVFEVSAVLDPAFQSAVVDSVLSNKARPGHNEKEDKMPDTTPEAPGTPDLTERMETLAGSVDTLSRQVATLGSTGPADAAVSTGFNSYGDFLKAVAARDPKAVEFLAYVGGVVGDLGGHVKDAWVGDLLTMIDEGRPILNLFETASLPTEGMGVEYGTVQPVSDTTAVGKQAAEGDVLPYGKIALDTDRAPVETFGGWAEMSRQEAERGPASIVDTYFRALVRRYAQATNAEVRALVTNAANATALAGPFDFATADGWIDFVCDAAFAMDDNGLQVQGLIVGRDVFKSLAKLRDGAATDAPRLLDRNSGTLDLTGLTGEMFRLPVIPAKSVAAGFVRAFHKSAITTWEAPGAPFRLQDDDITNLTHAMSVYGYLATGVTNKAALIAPGA